MATKDKLDSLQASVDAAKAAAAAPFDSISAGIADTKAGVDAEMQGQYSKGFADGAASVVNPGDPSRVFTQADLDKAVAGQSASDAVTIQGLQAQVAAMPSQIQAGIDSGVAAVKADLLTKLDAFQAGEVAGEQAFRAALEPSAT